MLSKEGKAPGGYCTYLADYKAPFIFSNFTGTSDDVDVLTHEAGHAFAAVSYTHLKNVRLNARARVRRQLGHPMRSISIKMAIGCFGPCGPSPAGGH